MAIKQFIFVLASLLSSYCCAESRFGSTYLIEVKQGSELSEKVNFYTGAGFESSNGGFVSFRPWYETKWTDARIAFMTEITDNIGFLWGFSSGEHGQKYRIDPSLKVGLAFFQTFSDQTQLSFKFTTILGGNLKESICMANYGDVGGVQAVNCRLAATPLPPSETLPYLFSDRPYNQTVINLELKHVF
jgi:hypothetical protein